MNDSENKKTPEELTDEALDKVTGGLFTENNCAFCRHYENFKAECPYGSPLYAVIALGGALQCPSKEV